MPANLICLSLPTLNLILDPTLTPQRLIKRHDNTQVAPFPIVT
jgi:hypothetical protein